MSNRHLTASSNDSPRLDYTREKIESFTQRPVGWHYGVGGPASRERADTALHLLSVMADHGLARTNAFYGSDGSISLTAYHSESYLELNLEPDGSIEYVEEEGTEEVGHDGGLTAEEAEDKIRDFKEKVWALSGLLTSPTGTTRGTSSTTGPLQGTELAYQLSTTTVRWIEAAAYAVILAASTVPPQAIPPLIGRSQTAPSLRLQDASTNECQAIPGMTATTISTG